MTRVVVAIDPAVTSGEEADETAIVVAGKDKTGHGYVLADISGRYPPTEWVRLAIAAYRTHRADRIVAEVNNGGDMVGATLRMVDRNVAFTEVRTAASDLPNFLSREKRCSWSDLWYSWTAATKITERLCHEVVVGAGVIEAHVRVGQPQHRGTPHTRRPV
jgi:hypothetical protein